MKRTYSLLVFLLLGVLSWSQDDITLEEHNLFGRVKQIETYQIDYKEVFGKVKENEERVVEVIRFDRKGMIQFYENEQLSTVYNYSDYDELIGKTVIHKDKLEKLFHDSKYVFHYKKGNVFEIERYDLAGGLRDKEIAEVISKDLTVFIKYDKLGNVIEKTKSLFDDRGNLIKTETISKLGEISFLNKREYDLENNCIRSEVIRFESIFTYDEYEYNSNKCIVKYKALDMKGLERTAFYDYKYDSDGNWIEKNTYIIKTEFGEERKVLESKQSRIIEYY